MFPVLVDVSLGAHVTQALVEGLREVVRASRRARAQWHDPGAAGGADPRETSPDVVWCTAAQGPAGRGVARWDGLHRVTTPLPDPVSCLRRAQRWLARHEAQHGDIVVLVNAGLVTVNASDAESVPRAAAAARLYRWLWRTVEAGASAGAPVLGPAVSAVGVPTLGGRGGGTTAVSAGRGPGPTARSLAHSDGGTEAGAGKAPALDLVESGVAQQLLRRLSQAPPLLTARGLVYGVLAVSCADATRLSRAAAAAAVETGRRNSSSGESDRVPWSWGWVRGRTERLASRGWAVSLRWAANLLGDDRASAGAESTEGDNVAAGAPRASSRSLLAYGRGHSRQRVGGADPHVSRALNAVVGAIQAASGDPRGRKRRAPHAAGEHWGRERRTPTPPHGGPPAERSSKRQLHALLAAELLSVCHFARTAAALHGLGLRLWRAAPAAEDGAGEPLLRLRASLGTLLLNQDPSLVMDLAPCARALDHVGGCNGAWSCLRGPQWGAAQPVVGLATVPARTRGAAGHELGLPSAVLGALAGWGTQPWRAATRMEALFHPLQGLQAQCPLVLRDTTSCANGTGEGHHGGPPVMHVMVQVDLAGAYPA